MNSFVNQELLDQVEAIWKNALEKFQIERDLVPICTEDQQVSYCFIDDTCQEIEDICLSRIDTDEDKDHFSRHLHEYCLQRRNQYIEIYRDSCSSQSFFLSYNPREDFVKETTELMISQLKSIKVEILTDSNIRMTNKTLDMDTFYSYDLHLINTRNQITNIDFINNTLINVHLYLDNSRMSAHIKDNVFTEAGITISSPSTDLHQAIVIHCNIFQGNKPETILEVRDTSNVYISSCTFINEQALFVPFGDCEACPGLLCYGSHIEIRDILFRNVSFSPVVEFENCIMDVHNVTLSEIDFSPLNSLLIIKHSEGVIENSNFEHNKAARCIEIEGGNITFQNMNVVYNKQIEIGSISEAIWNVFNAYIFKNSGTSFFFRFSDSEASIIDSIFNENNGGIIMSVENNSQAFVRESIFYGNKYWNLLNSY